ncbi:MAG: AAA family ATPase [Candidatus Binatia bacterium]|nr:AAA family ATPase [Candidatus Binatia bacterium]
MEHPTFSFADLLTALARPESYPHRPTRVEVIQTHISAVFLAGDLVYKLKKPVHFSFLDYSTRERRYYYCHEEVRLNRRLAPTVYLGVVPLVYASNTYRVEDGSAGGEAVIVDHLVKMRRLPADRTLVALIAAGRCTAEEMQALAKRLVSFHRSATTRTAPRYGTPEAVWQTIAENFRDTAPFIGETISPAQDRRIQSFSQHFFAEHQELLRARVRSGRVREGHGDLRCEHVYFLDEGITIVDCIEFSPRLRTCDVASEIAFLAMDLELQSAPQLAAELVQTYAAEAKDGALFHLLPFYQCYRAYVRGKVASLRSREPEVPDTERTRAKIQARQAFCLAYRYACGPPSPAVLVVCGRIGTGKSTLARALNGLTGFPVLSSDVIRKQLAGLSPTTRMRAEYRAGIYTEAFTQHTYLTLAQRAESALQAGQGVIIDATCKRREDRRRFLELGARFSTPVLFIECRASAATVEQRLRAREQEAQSVSDATWSTAQQAQGDFPPFDDIPKHQYLAIDTEDDAAVQEALMQIDERLRR